MQLSPRTSWRLTMTGWVLFTISAVFFTVSALDGGGAVEIIASVTFLIACFVFLVPALDDRPRDTP